MWNAEPPTKFRIKAPAKILRPANISDPSLVVTEFLRLQDELAGTENRIAVERKRYNDTLQDYNTYIQKFPNNLYAGWAGFKPNNAYFAAAEGSRQVPTVNFSPSTATPPPAPQPAPAK